MTPNLIERLDDGPLSVETRGLVKRFGRRTALEGLDLTVPEGAVYVLVGPNGAGKTTALRLLLDLIRADEGRAAVFGLSTVERGAEIRARVGYVPEGHAFGMDDLSVDGLFSHHATYFPAWDADYATGLAEALDVALDVRYGKLSKGQARRVQLVLALAHRPELLLMDEPTDGLDPLARDLVFRILADHLAETPTTVLVSTHLVHEVEGLGDCLGVLDGGRLAAQQRREALDRYLHRVRFDVSETWSEPSALEATVIERSGTGRDRVWTFWADPDSSRMALREAGATVRGVDSLNLEETTRTLLRRGRS